MKLLALLLVGLSGTAVAGPRVHYRLGFAERARHQLTVEMIVSDAPSPLPLAMPVWTLGAYEIRTWGKNVTVDQATAGSTTLASRRTSPSTFVVEGHAAHAEVHVFYRVYAATLSDDGSHVDARHAYLNPTSCLLYVPSLFTETHAMTIVAPPGWQTATALTEAASYEALVDGPVEVGHFARAEVVAAGRIITVVVDGEGATVPKQLLSQIQAIVAAEVGMVGPPPWTRYLLLIHLEDGLDRAGALEHAASASVLVPRRTLVKDADGKDNDAYQDLLYVIAHEMFHAWNARLLRPVELMPWDPLVPRPARSLWITEGVTEFFAHRAMLLAGLWTPERWRDQVCEEVARASLAESRGLSIEEDAELAWSTPTVAADDPDAYYARGHLAALAVDSLTPDHGLIVAVRALLAEAVRQQRPIAVDTERLAAALAPDAGRLLRQLAAGHDEVAVATRVLATRNLVLTVEKITAPFIGLGLETDTHGLRVLHVFPSSAAQLAGLRAADVITAVDGKHPTLPMLEAAPANVAIKLAVKRDRRPLALSLTPETLTIPRCSLTPQ